MLYRRWSRSSSSQREANMSVTHADMLACTSMRVWKNLVKLIWNKDKDLSDCDTKSWRLSVSSTQPVWYKSHVCFPMSLHIHNFKKAISVTALDKQQNQHRGKRNGQNMYTQMRSSWRYWMKTEIFLCFMFCLAYFLKIANLWRDNKVRLVTR